MPRTVSHPGGLANGEGWRSEPVIIQGKSSNLSSNRSNSARRCSDRLNREYTSFPADVVPEMSIDLCEPPCYHVRRI